MVRGATLAALLGVIGTIGATAASAAPAASTPAPVSAEPATTSASFGDWILRCQRVGDGAAAKRVCEVSEAIRTPDGRDPVAEVALGRLPAEKALHLTALLPPNVSFPSTVTVAAATGPGLDLQWRRCLPGGCFADSATADDAVKGWRAQSAAGKLTFKDAAGHDLALPLSFRGLAQALDALDKS